VRKADYRALIIAALRLLSALLRLFDDDDWPFW
jgi:hypothetical protein